MSVVVDIAGTQFNVDKSSVLNVPLLKGEPGDIVEFDKILLSESNGNVVVGAPLLSGLVKAKILEHGKDEKIWVFHKKRRKGHRKLNGHRQKYTQIEVTDIVVNN
ncbi:MAG TPA: 50S ribosomal protein L21 [Candidatus Kapabacteria bacterium]|nr:50S ribosomal protein L21 [Candidatus Kapabacteria bacterium]